MKQKSDVQEGAPGLMVLKALNVLGPLHGHGITRFFEVKVEDFK